MSSENSLVAINKTYARDYCFFLGFIHHPVFQTTQRFGNWICFHRQVRGWETYTLLGTLERANLNHWRCFRNVALLKYRTMDKVQDLAIPSVIHHHQICSENECNLHPSKASTAMAKSAKVSSDNLGHSVTAGRCIIC
jgi:hypothetical protein